MRVLFLDIDGVLNSHRTAIAFGGMPFDVDKQRGMFDEVAVQLIAGIVKAAGAKIVLSSSWRLTHDFRNVGSALGMPIIDRTPSLTGPRGKEIAAWLDAHQASVERYAIVDDDGDMLPEQMPYFVKTNMKEGFTWNCAEKLSELMGIRLFDVNRAAPLRAESKTLQWEDGEPPVSPSPSVPSGTENE